jgi:hypothetical protein
VVRESDLFAAYPACETFDLIYENLPNVPDGADLFDGIRSASCYAPRTHGTESIWDRQLLTLHHDFLVQAHSRLNDSGHAVCVIGGRIPVEAIHEMFRMTGYQSVVVGFGLKIQSEADVVLPGYARVEAESGSTFSYYHPLEKCVAICREIPQPAEMVERENYARRLTDQLNACRISATEAIHLHNAGDPVCHTVYVIAGSPIRKERADA